MDGMDRLQWRNEEYYHLMNSIRRLLVWLFLDITLFGKPCVIGIVQGMISSLVYITPIAGLVQGWATMIMGMLSGNIPWYTMMMLHKRICFLTAVVDNTLVVFYIHAIDGSFVGILSGFFADSSLNHLFFGNATTISLHCPFLCHQMLMM